MSRTQKVVETVVQHLYTAEDPISTTAEVLGLAYDTVLNTLLSSMNRSQSRPFSRYLKNTHAVLLVGQWWLTPDAPETLCNRILQEQNVVQVYSTESAEMKCARLVVLIKGHRQVDVQQTYDAICRLICGYNPVTIISNNYFVLGKKITSARKAVRSGTHKH